MRVGFNLDRVQFKTISKSDNDMLCSVIMEHEILVVVRLCGSKKNPWFL